MQVWAAEGIPDLGTLTKDLPPWAVVLVVVSVAAMFIALAAVRIIPLFKSEKPTGRHGGGAPAEPPVTPPRGGAASKLAQAADTNTELIERILDRLDAANEEMKRLRDSYEEKINRLLADVSARDATIFELRAHLADLERNLVSAREDAARLRWQLDQQYQHPASGRNDRPW